MKQKTETMLCITFMKLLRKCPFSKITIQKLTGQCGVNRQTFYYHFDNIYDLMARSFEYELVCEKKIYEEVTWRKTMTCLLGWIKENRQVMKNIMTNAEIFYFKRAMYPLIERSISLDRFPDISSSVSGEGREKFAAHFLTIGMTQYILEWIESDFRQPVDEIVSDLFWLVQKIYHK